ncbi:secretion protein EccK [Mycobacterium sp. CBMA361]|nr:secretion protein EccK [Mycolicibacterium sp. CBMA 361]
MGPTGPGVAAASANNQQAAAAAAPIPVSPARAERDAAAAAAKAGLLQRKSAGNTDADIEIARRISAALHAPPSIPEPSFKFVWAVGVTTEGQILAANSYGIGFIPDRMKLPGQVMLVSADEAIPPGERGRWVNFPFLALQGWAQFHGKTLRAIIGMPDEVKPYKSSTHTEELAPDDIPASGAMQGRSRLQVIAPEAAARLEEWSDLTLYEALPPRPVQDAPPDPKQTIKLWVDTIKPLLRTTGTNGPIDHLKNMIAYADHMQSVELYKAYTAPHVAAQREAMSDWIYWQHISSICQDATNPVLGGVQV